MSKPLRVMMLGLRGFPGVQGGVETHAEHLCPRLAALGCDVTVLARKPYQLPDTGPVWRGVKFVSLWAPKSKGLEAIAHSMLGVLYAAWRRPDILHIQAIGPAIVTLPARLLGLRVVVTHHGPDYDRQKWGGFARWALRTGERWGMRLSQGRIVISRVIAAIVRDKHGRDSTLVPNGVVLPALPEATDTLQKFGLEAGKYVVLVSRLVPEKRHLDLIDAFERAALPGWKLAIVGGSDHPDEYQRAVLARAEASPAIVCTGSQGGAALAQLYGHAGMFVLPSSHEGLPIALLEALSYGLPVIASDIPANLEVGLSQEHYTPLGDVAALAERMKAFAAQPNSDQLRAQRRQWVSGRYDWDAIAAATLDVYRQASGLDKR
ncbi:glycosyltransferase involved in cell wall biosynthesis [Duganella sp. SG902]|uniref:glycosyltransferase family 4 protein n=1 Tax=Duganella sp. SG902 TaxID=2587016 RepID=UPI0017B390DE|nr:glycosyltransferase involved in cell wall biosynthesis [Duganella sp. SG902]